MGIHSQQIETWVCLRMGDEPQHSNRENDDQAWA